MFSHAEAGVGGTKRFEVVLTLELQVLAILMSSNESPTPANWTIDEIQDQATSCQTRLGVSHFEYV